MNEIIISGRAGSGKTWLSEVLTAPLLETEVFRTTGFEASKLLTAFENQDVSKSYKLIIIDECKPSEIQELSDWFNHQLSIVLNPVLNFPKSKETTIVYCTQAPIDRKEVAARFRVFYLQRLVA